MKSLMMSMEPKKKVVKKKLYDDKKYKEAAERNFINVQRYCKRDAKTGSGMTINKYFGLSLAAAKMKLGVRKVDSTYDKEIAHFLLSLKPIVAQLKADNLVQEDSKNICMYCGEPVSNYYDYGICDQCNSDMRGEL